MTPNYIVMEETKMRELRLEAVRRAVKYEETARRSKKKLVVECMKELEREEIGREESKWEKKRRESFVKSRNMQGRVIYFLKCY